MIIPSAVQPSAPINPGNSGGALVDITGRVIGIPTLAATDPEFGGAQAPGIGFAVPSNTARNVAAKLIVSGHVSQAERAFLGVDVSTIVGGGVLVESVQRGGPAGPRGDPRAGDVIVAVGGTPTPTPTTEQLALTKFRDIVKHVIEGARSRQISDTGAFILDRVLLMFIIAELLYTLRLVNLGGRILVEPFLFIGLIAVVRRVLVITAEFEAGRGRSSDFVSQIGALSELAIAFTLAIYLFRRSERRDPV